MDITIDIDNPVPQFEQLIEHIKAAVTSGALKAGDALPSIRQLANDLELIQQDGGQGLQAAGTGCGHRNQGLPRHLCPTPRPRRTARSTCRNGYCASSGETVAELRDAGCDRFRNPQRVRRCRQPATAGKVRCCHDRSLCVLCGFHGANTGRVRAACRLVYTIRSRQGGGAISGLGPQIPRALSQVYTAR